MTILIFIDVSWWYFLLKVSTTMLHGSYMVFDYHVLTVVVLPSSVLPRLFISESAIHRGRTILRTIFILFGDVPSSKCSTVPRTSRFFRSSVHPFFGSVILGDSRNGGWSLRAGWETSIWRGPDSGKPGWRSRDPRRFGSCLLLASGRTARDGKRRA